jgi:hypothetical protein
MTASWIYELSGDLISIGLELWDGNSDSKHCFLAAWQQK